MRLSNPLAGLLGAPLIVLLMAPSAPGDPAQPEPVPADTARDDACGSALTAQEAEAFVEFFTQTDPDPGDTPIGSPYYVKIAPHIVRRSDGTGGLPMSQFEQGIADANLHFAGTGITFFTYGHVDYIDSDAFYFDISTLNEINALRTTNQVPDAINVYFTPNLAYEGGGLCGISAFTTSPVQAIAIRNDCVAFEGNHSTFSHEIAHFFDIFHTHETVFGAELVDGSNCAIAGDRICDTPADPRLTSSTVNHSTCTYTGAEIDGNGDPYVPDATLMMSFSWKHCRDSFTPETNARIVSVLTSDDRDYLLLDPVSVADPGFEAAAGQIALSKPRPNPTSDRAEMRFSVDRPARVEVTVHDVRGARVRTIAYGLYAPGEHAIGWDGTNGFGERAAPGIYFARMTALGEVASRKVHLLR